MVEPSDQECAFGAEVARQRIAQRVTQDWVGQRVGLARSKISEIEHGRFLPSWSALDALVAALALDRDRAVRLWKEATDARQRRLDAERVAALPAPRGWVGSQALPGEVRSLLHAQRRAGMDLPYRLPGARPVSLASVYVRQELGGTTEERPPERPEPVLDVRGQLHLPVTPVARLSVRPPTRTIRDVLDSHDHLLVTGGAGRGKSTLSLRLPAEIAAAWDSPDGVDQMPLAEPVVPLRLTARMLAGQLGAPFAQALAACVRADYGALLPQAGVDAARLAVRVVGYRWLLLVDGLDEVADPVLRDRLVTVLAARASDPDPSPYRILLTTRPVDSPALVTLQQTAGRYELQPFDETALRRFADQWFASDGGGEAAGRFVRQIRAAHLDELVREPLLATIAAIIFDQHPGRPLPDNQYELYEDYLAYLLAARATSVPPWLAPLRTELLEYLGRQRLTSDTLLTAAARGWIADRPIDRPPGWQNELAGCLDTLGPLGRRGEDVQFLHHSFAEHLAATAEARTLPAMFDPRHTVLANLVHTACQDLRGRYARRVLLHYTRLHTSQADRLVERLHQGNPDEQLLAAQLLAKHAPTSAAVVDVFLATARGWAQTTLYPGGAILDEVSRATHHPDLTRWLADLMRDPAAPWPSRIAAASALATRLPGSLTDQAARLLRTVIQDEDAPVTDRLTAAEALADCGPDQRDAAERGLCALLAYPSIPARRWRKASVVLAGLGPRARAHAVAVLSGMLDDAETPGRDLVEFALGLVEIGVEFHQRCATCLRGLIHNPSHNMIYRTRAAVGLATLGPRQLAEAVAALTAAANDRSEYWTNQVHAAAALAEIGSQYRPAAGRLLLAMLAEPGLDTSDRRHCASALAGLGAEFHGPAAAHLRAVIADHNGSADHLFWAICDLADLGPEYHPEAARAFHRLAADPLVDGNEHASSLARLAELGEPHREPAIDRLRAELVDRDADPANRVEAAKALVGLGPQHHHEVADALLDILTGQLSIRVVTEAWCTLATLGTRFQQHAADALLDVLRAPESSNTAGRAVWELAGLDQATQLRAADVLGSVLADRTRGCRSRARAAQGLVQLGRQHHRRAVGGFLSLLGDPGTTGAILDEVFWFEEIGPGVRARWVDGLRAVMTAEPDQAAHAAGRLSELGADDDPAVVAALRVRAADQALGIADRRRAAVALATIGPSLLPDARTALHDILVPTSTEFGWEDALLDYARLGGDAVTLARALLTDPCSTRESRQAAASALPMLDPELAGEAIAELRQQAADPHLNLEHHIGIVARLAKLDPATSGDAITFTQAVLDDDGQPVALRSWAAYQLVQLDRGEWPAAVATLRRLVNTPLATPAEQERAVTWLTQLKALRPDETIRLALAVAHHPATPTAPRRSVIKFLPLRLRTNLQRAQLDDRTAPVTLRVPERDHREDPPLAGETEAALRDVLTAGETTYRGRIAAAEALADLAPVLVPLAADTLEQLARLPCQAAFDALVALARLGTSWRRRVIDTVTQIVNNESMPRRHRHHAADVFERIKHEPPATVIALLRAVAADERASAVRRVDALSTLSGRDGPDMLRTLRDNPDAPPIARFPAAHRLIRYTASDRASAAALFHQIATDPTSRPALRHQAANQLAQLGTPGHQQATAALRAMATDPMLPVTARTQAARLLGELRPSARREALTILRGLTGTANPLHRVQVHRAIGALDTAEPLTALRAMAQDHTLSPVVRLRSAQALARLRTDHREAASLVARELMNDHTVAHHIRAHAAGHLARWSALCRQEARETLRALRASWPRRELSASAGTTDTIHAIAGQRPASTAAG